MTANKPNRRIVSPWGLGTIVICSASAYAVLWGFAWLWRHFAACFGG